MDHLLRSVESSIAANNWYAALATSLALPDICGWLRNPNAGSKARYTEWFDQYIAHKYTREVGRERVSTVFLSASDCYALRCAFLHEGREDITEQRARALIDRFEFTVVPPGWMVHCNLVGTKLQLQVDLFCLDLVEGVRQFQRDHASDLQTAQRSELLLRLHDVNGNVLP